MSLAQLARLRRLGWAGHVLRRNELMIHKVVFSRANSKRCGRHRTLIAGLTDLINQV